MGKRLLILGGGESGTGAARLAAAKGWDVLVSDTGMLKPKYKHLLSDHGIDFEEGSNEQAKIFAPDEVVKSPGIPDSSATVQYFLQSGIPVISEIEFAGRYTKARFVAVTGSNGKTTTTLLIHHILKRAGLKVAVGGNVGISLASILLENDELDWIVLELSSFQLDGMFKFKVDVAILLNITPDHLDRYGYDLMQYARSKIRITQNQDEACWFVYNSDDPVTKELMKSVEIKARTVPLSIEHETDGFSAYADQQSIHIKSSQPPLTMSIQELALQGKHNLYNSMAAGIAARILDVRKDIIRECLSDFQNVEHRLEHVNSIYGIGFINDSKATNVNSTWYALESMSQPVVWIAGGIDKGNDYAQLREMVKGKVKAIVCLGKDNSKLIAAFKDLVENIVETDTMRDAVYAAYKFGNKGDVVLLSPACASFDLFQDYEDRGRQFKEAVRNL